MIGQPITATAVQLIQVKASGNLSTAKGAVFANDDDGGMVDAGVSNFDHALRLPWGCDIWRFVEALLNNKTVTIPGPLGAGVVVGLDLASLASRAVLDAVARDAEVRVVRADED